MQTHLSHAALYNVGCSMQTHLSHAAWYNVGYSRLPCPGLPGIMWSAADSPSPCCLYYLSCSSLSILPQPDISERPQVEPLVGSEFYFLCNGCDEESCAHCGKYSSQHRYCSTTVAIILKKKICCKENLEYDADISE